MSRSVFARGEKNTKPLTEREILDVIRVKHSVQFVLVAVFVFRIFTNFSANFFLCKIQPKISKFGP